MKIPSFVYFRKDTVPTYDLRRPDEAKRYLKEEKHFKIDSKDLPPILRFYPPHWAPFNATQYSIFYSKFEPEKRKINAKSNINHLKNIDVGELKGVKDKDEANNIQVYLGHFNDLVEQAGEKIAKISDNIQEPINNKRKQMKNLKSSHKLNLSISFGSGATTLGLGIYSGITNLKLQTGIDYSPIGVAALGLFSIGVAVKASDGFSWAVDKVISYQIDRLENKRRVEENKIFEGLLKDTASTFEECLPHYAKGYKEKKTEGKGIEIIMIPPETESRIQN